VVVVGWAEVDDLGTTRSRDDIAAKLRAGYPSASPNLIGNWTGQLHRFCHEIQKGDLVLTPLARTNTVAVGKVTGEYLYRSDLPDGAHHTRPVQWLRHDLARTAFGQDLLYSLGSLLTVARISRNDAARRIGHIVAHDTDPGASLTTSGRTAAVDTDADAEQPALDIGRYAQDQINSHIAKHFSGHDMARLVEGIFVARGMTTFSSPEGPDGGIDVLAGSGPLGMDSPRICVQVKFTAGPADVGVVRQLEGVMQRVRADQGLLVSWNGLTSAAEREVKQQYFRVRVWKADDVLRELASRYDDLPEEIQIKLPLKRVWMLATEESGAVE
jgi:restriction system protein